MGINAIFKKIEGIQAVQIKSTSPSFSKKQLKEIRILLKKIMKVFFIRC